MISVVEIGIGAVAAVAIAAGIRNGSRQVPKHTPHDAKSKVPSQPEATLRSLLFHETKWTLAGHLLLMAILIILAAFGLFEDNHAAALLGIIASAYALYRIAKWSAMMVCLGDRRVSAPDLTPTASES